MSSRRRDDRTAAIVIHTRRLMLPSVDATTPASTGRSLTWFTAAPTPMASVTTRGDCPRCSDHRCGSPYVAQAHSVHVTLGLRKAHRSRIAAVWAAHRHHTLRTQRSIALRWRSDVGLFLGHARTGAQSLVRMMASDPTRRPTMRRQASLIPWCGAGKMAVFLSISPRRQVPNNGPRPASPAGNNDDRPWQIEWCASIVAARRCQVPASGNQRLRRIVAAPYLWRSHTPPIESSIAGLGMQVAMVAQFDTRASKSE